MSEHHHRNDPTHAASHAIPSSGGTPHAGFEGLAADGASQAELSSADQQIVDALVESAFADSGIHGFGSSGTEDRRRHVLGLLSMLGAGAVAAGDRRELLIDLTLARVVLQRRAERDSGDHASCLTADDRDALEQLVSAGFDPGAVSSMLRPRAQRASELLAMLEPPEGLLHSDAESSPRADADRLVRLTMERVRRAEADQRTRLSIPPAVEQAPIGRRFRMSDLVSVAALLLIATAVIGPMVSSVRGVGQRLACQSNMGSLASAFGLYAGDSKDALPLASASMAGTPWWNVGKVQESNSANLYTLSRTGYTKLVTLACPTNPRGASCASGAGDMDWKCLDEVSFSFQNLFAKERPTWSSGKSRVVVLVDRSPVVPLAVRGFKINPLSNSPSHGFVGQNALFNDGSSVWLRSPVLESGDNIWLPRVIESMLVRAGVGGSGADAGKGSHVPRAPVPCVTETDPLKGTESPASSDDSFVGP